MVPGLSYQSQDLAGQAGAPQSPLAVAGLSSHWALLTHGPCPQGAGAGHAQLPAVAPCPSTSPLPTSLELGALGAAGAQVVAPEGSQRVGPALLTQFGSPRSHGPGAVEVRASPGTRGWSGHCLSAAAVSGPGLAHTEPGARAVLSLRTSRLSCGATAGPGLSPAERPAAPSREPNRLGGSGLWEE